MVRTRLGLEAVEGSGGRAVRRPGDPSPRVRGRRAVGRRRPGVAAGAGTSWRRIAASRSRSVGEGSMPRPSTSALRGLAVGGQRVGLAAGAVEGEHELAVQALAQRMLAHQCLDLAGDLDVAPAGEVGVEALGETREPQVVEPGDLRCGEALVARRRRAPARATARAPGAASPRPPRLAVARARSRPRRRPSSKRRRRGRPGRVPARIRRPPRDGAPAEAARRRDATTWTALRAFRGPLPSHSSSRRGQGARRRRGARAAAPGSDSARPRGMRAPRPPPRRLRSPPRILNWSPPRQRA